MSLLKFGATLKAWAVEGLASDRRMHAPAVLCVVLVPLTAATVLAGWPLAVSCLLGWCLLAAAVIDARTFRLPDRLILPLIPAGFAVAALRDTPLAPHVVGGLAGYAGFVGLNLLYRSVRGRDGVGRGDAKLLAAAGAWVGWQDLPSVVLIAAVAALAWVLLRRFGMAATREGPLAPMRGDTAVPFGPFLGLGLWVVWLYGAIVLTD